MNLFSSSNNSQRRGAAEARRAHNPDVLGLKPSGAKFFLFSNKKSQKDI